MRSRTFDRALRSLESGRRPVLIALLASFVLAGSTAVRFLVLVQTISPGEYGLLNVFTMLATLMPLLMSLGLTLQYQRVAHFEGPTRILHLVKLSLVTTAASVVPSFAIIVVVCKPLTNGNTLVLASIFIVLISAATALCTFSSQIMLGLNYRSTASLMMFFVNVGATVALLPAALTHAIETTVILGWWALFAVLAAFLAQAVVRSRRVNAPPLTGVISLREGIFSIPSQIGPWLFLFVVRYLIGFNIDEAAIANYAIAATVVDMAFLVAVSMLSYFTNRVMSGSQGPGRGLLLSIPLFLLLSLAGAFGVAWILPQIGRPGYQLLIETTAILVAVGVVRIYISAWRARAIGMKRMHFSSSAYIVVVATSVLICVAWPSESLNTYALLTLAGFLAVAIVQRLSIMRPRASQTVQKGSKRRLLDINNGETLP